MFISIQNICSTIESKLYLIELNKTAPVEAHVIIATNEKLLNDCKNLFLTLKKESCNKVLINKYSNLINSITVI